MKKALLLFFIILITGKSSAQLEEDKVLHFIGGNLYGLVGAGVANQISKGDRTWTFVGAVGGSLIIGIAKESIDKKQYDGWDNNDLLATVLGGVTVGVTIDIFKQRKKRKRERLLKEAIGCGPIFRTNKKLDFREVTSLHLLGISSNLLSRP